MDIKEARKEIDTVNREMALLLKRRMELSEYIAEYKKENLLPVKDEKREEEIKEEMQKIAGEKFKDETDELFTLLFKLSCEYQEKYINSYK